MDVIAITVLATISLVPATLKNPSSNWPVSAFSGIKAGEGDLPFK